jgi:hypothetical protein
MFPCSHGKILELLCNPPLSRTHSYDGNLPYYNFKIGTDRERGQPPQKKGEKIEFRMKS